MIFFISNHTIKILKKLLLYALISIYRTFTPLNLLLLIYILLYYYKNHIADLICNKNNQYPISHSITKGNQINDLFLYFFLFYF